MNADTTAEPGALSRIAQAARSEGRRSARGASKVGTTAKWRSGKRSIG